MANSDLATLAKQVVEAQNEAIKGISKGWLGGLIGGDKADKAFLTSYKDKADKLTPELDIAEHISILEEINQLLIEHVDKLNGGENAIAACETALRALKEKKLLSSLPGR